MYQSDIRSMINFIQLNQNLSEWSGHIIHMGVWEDIHQLLYAKDTMIGDFLQKIHTYSVQYNMDKKILMQSYFNYTLRTITDMIRESYLNMIENCIHNAYVDNDSFLQFVFHEARKAN